MCGRGKMTMGQDMHQQLRTQHIMVVIGWDDREYLYE